MWGRKITTKETIDVLDPKGKKLNDAWFNENKLERDLKIYVSDWSKTRTGNIRNKNIY